MEIKIEKATEKDIPLISELAKKIWNDHYPEIISQQQIDFMLEKMYSANSLREQLNELGHSLFLIRDAGKAIGFISVSSKDQKNWNLHKFYMMANEQKKGVGTKVFKLILQFLNHPQSIHLNVNRSNYRSINFYFKNGFTIDKVVDLDIGGGYFMNDFEMMWRAK